MPKKSRKMKQRAASRRSAVQVPQATVPDEPVASIGDTTVRMRPIITSPRSTSLQDYDYSHIYRDLKRIAAFAGFFFAVLIVLSFVIK